MGELGKLVLLAAVIVGAIYFFSGEGERSAAGAYDEPYRPAPLAASISLSVDAVRTNAVYLPVASVTVTNNSDVYANVHVQCTFLNGDAVAGDGIGLLNNVGPGQSARGTVTSAAQRVRFDRAECRVDTAWASP